MAVTNALWGAPRIYGALLKLGFDVSERTISRLMPRRRRQQLREAFPDEERAIARVWQSRSGAG
jgi:hypothetical protein